MTAKKPSDENAGSGSTNTERFSGQVELRQALRESEERYRVLFQSIDEGFCVIEVVFDDGRPVDYIFLDVNPAFEKHAGLSNVVGRHARDLVPDLDQHWFDAYGHVLHTGESLRFQNVAAALGRVFDVFAFRVDPPESRRVGVLFSDITQRHRTEDALRQSEERFRAFVTASSDVVYCMSADWREMRHLQGREFIADTFEPDTTWLDKYIHPADQPLVLQTIQQAIAAKRTFELEHRVLRVDGTLGWTHSRAVPILNERGEVVEWFGAASDVTERKRAEAAANASESRFGRVFSNNMVPMGIWQKSGEIVSANDAFLDMVGYTRAELESGKVRWEDLTPVEYASRDAQAIAEVESNGMCAAYEKVFLHKLGRRIPILIGGGRFDEGDGAGIFFAVDLTARNAAEAAFRESEARYRTLFDAMDEGYCIIEVLFDGRNRAIDYRFVEVNGSFERQAGMRDVVGRRMLEFVSEIESHWLENYGKVALTGQPIRFSGEYQGLNRYFDVYAFRPNGWPASHVAVLFADVTQRTRAEQDRLAELDATRHLQQVSVHLTNAQGSEALYESIMDAARTIMRSDCASMQLHEPRSGEVGVLRLLTSRGLDPQTAEFWKTVRADSHCCCAEVLRTGERCVIPNVATCEYVVGTPDHAEFRRTGIVAVQSTPLRSRDSTLLGVISTHWKQPHVPSERDLRLFDVLARQAADWIERLRIEATLRESEARFRMLADSERTARAAAEAAGKLKDEFLATLSHELRTPLNAILGWSQLLARSPNNPELIDEGLRVIARNSKTQAELISDLLDMSRITSGKLCMELANVDLAEVIAASIQVVQPAADTNGVSIAFDPPRAPLVVHGDAGRLKQVVWNLLSNSVKFTPRGGRVTVHLEQADSRARITVSDTGDGIAPEFLQHLFERFRQGDASAARNHGGLGLGLSIVKNLVELHGGVVRADSAGRGAGTTFTVELPLRSADVHEPADSHLRQNMPSISSEDVDLNGLTVLTVDDQADSRELIRRVLEDHKARVITAGSTDEALRVLGERQPHIVLCDVGMPGKDGYEFIREMRRRGHVQPALAVTAFVRPEDRQQAILAGFQGHIPKPIDPARLVSAVASFADNQSREA